MDPVIFFRSIQKTRQKGQLSVAQLFRLYRNRSRLTQSDLAQKIGLHTDRMVRKWENGQSLPESGRLKKLIEFYLAASTFTFGHEKEEALQLWETVKETFEYQNSSFKTYSYFDAAWFEALIQTVPPAQLAVPTFAPGVALELPTFPGSQADFIGREMELNRLAAILQGVRLLTISGPPGVGKSCLAHRLLSGQEGNFKDGVVLCNLDTAAGPDKLLLILESELSLVDNLGGSPADLLKFLRNKEILLVLDHLDEVLPEGIPLLRQILKNCPELKIVVTSRESLDIAGELVFHLKPLAVFLPAFASLAEPEKKELSPAARLFVERARAIQDDFDITPATFPVIEEICQKLDGLPLAIKLAASLTEVLTVEQILTRLVDPFALLTGEIHGKTRTKGRQQGLEKNFEASFARLNPFERSVLKMLCEIPGPFGIEMARHKLRENGLEENENDTPTLDALEGLVKKSLVEVDRRSQGFTFSILGTVRIFSLKEDKISRGMDGKQ